MQLLQSVGVPPPGPSDVVVYEGWVSRLLNAAVYLLFAVAGFGAMFGLPAAWYLDWFDGELGGLDAAIGALVGAMFALVGYSGLATSVRRTNWLMRLTPSGIWIKFRSDANARLPEPHPVVLLLPYDRIVWARLTREWVKQISLGGKTSTARVWTVDLSLDTDKADAAERDMLADALRAEMTYKPPSGMTLSHRYPVKLDDNLLRIDWWRGLKPGRSAFFDALKYYVPIEEPLELTLDLSDAVSDADADEKIAELARRGDVLSAVHLARRVKRLSLADARAWVERAKGRV